MLNRWGRVRITVATAIAVVGIVSALMALSAARPPASVGVDSSTLLTPSGPIKGVGSSSLNGQHLPTAGGQSAVFYVSGSVSGLFPGGASNLYLQVQNPFSFNIHVNTLTIVPASATNCAATYLTFNGTQYQSGTIITLNPSLEVPAGTTSPVGAVPPEPVGLVLSAPSSCIGAIFSLTYGGSAVQG